MMIGAAPLSALPLASLRASVINYIRPVTLDDVSMTDTCWLVEVDLYTGSGASTRFRPAALASGPLAALPLGSRIDAGLTTLRHSDTGWIGEPNDPDRPNVPYYSRIEKALQMQREVPVLPEADRRARLSYGKVRYLAGDGALDTAIARWAVSRRGVRIYRGRRTVPYASPFGSFVPMFRGVGVGWSGDELRADLEVRDASYRLETPWQQDRYTGTGGPEGTSEWANKPKPFVAGRKRNIQADLVDPVHLVYRFHCREALSVLAARDRGGALSLTMDYPTYAALIAAPLTTSQYATCLALGLVRTGGLSPALRLDVDDDAHGGFAATHGEIALRALEYAGVTAAELVAGGFKSLPAGLTGFYWSSAQTPTTAQVMSEIVGSCAGWWGPGRTGLFEVGRLYNPAVPLLSIDTTNLRGEPTELPTPGAARWRQRVAYRVLGTTQQGADLLDTVTAAERAYYEVGYQVTEAGDPGVLIRDPDADDPDPLITGFDEEADAKALAAVLFGLFRAPVRLWRVPVGSHGFLVDLNQPVRLTYPMRGLSGGPIGMVVGQDIDDDDVTPTIAIFGQ